LYEFQTRSHLEFCEKQLRCKFKKNEAKICKQNLIPAIPMFFGLVDAITFGLEDETDEDEIFNDGESLASPSFILRLSTLTSFARDISILDRCSSR
jgi:hypothetical protein